MAPGPAGTTKNVRPLPKQKTDAVSVVPLLFTPAQPAPKPHRHPAMPPAVTGGPVMPWRTSLGHAPPEPCSPAANLSPFSRRGLSVRRRAGYSFLHRVSKYVLFIIRTRSCPVKGRFHSFGGVPAPIFVQSIRAGRRNPVDFFRAMRYTIHDEPVSSMKYRRSFYALVPPF